MSQSLSIETARYRASNLEAVREADDLGFLNKAIGPASMRAGWNKKEPSLWPAPKQNFVPHSWNWEFAKVALDAAGRLIDTEQAERRNLFLVNPLEGNYYATLRTLVSAYQMILPGEQASSHRHTANALRLVLDVEDACYTIVDGVRIDMKPRDVVLTPGWAWHGHGNEGGKPGYWVDYLDVPLVHLLEPMFFELWPQKFQAAESQTRSSSLVFPWAATEKLLAAAGNDRFGRRKIVLDAPALKTMALDFETIPASVRISPARTTANQIVTVVEGEGATTIDGETISWKKGDVMAIPNWRSYSHEVSSEAVLFTVSDRPVLEKLGFHRTENEQ